MSVDAKLYTALEDEMIADIMEASIEDLENEFREEGLDPEDIAQGMRACLERAARQVSVGEWTMQVVGRSPDGRTNLWRITPPCGHRPFSPLTTRFAVQRVECPKCGLAAVAHYNEGRIVAEAAA